MSLTAQKIEAMKRAKKSAGVQIYCLPNHSWLPEDWVQVGSKHDTPEKVVRRTANRVLMRNHNWSEAKTGRRYNYSEKFCGKHHPNESWKTIDLYVWGNTTIGILGQKAKDGNRDAAEELWRLAHEATALLTQVCKSKPELLRRLARINRCWPVFKKKNEDLNTAEKDLFTKIQLGKGDFVELDANAAKWRLDDAGLIAYYLLVYLLRARGDVSDSDTLNYGKFGEAIKKNLLHKFDAENAKSWWKVAKTILLITYPEPHLIEELNRLVPNKILNKSGKLIDNPKRKSPGRIDAAIFRILESRFVSFARNDY